MSALLVFLGIERRDLVFGRGLEREATYGAQFVVVVDALTVVRLLELRAVLLADARIMIEAVADEEVAAVMPVHDEEPQPVAQDRTAELTLYVPQLQYAIRHFETGLLQITRVVVALP